jgi:hypothetical protein
MKKLLVSAILLVAMMGAFAQYWSLEDEGKTIQYVDVEKVFAFAFTFLEDKVMVTVADNKDFYKAIEDVYFTVDFVYTRQGKGKVIDGLFVFALSKEDMKRFLTGRGLAVVVGEKGFGLRLEGLRKPEIYKLIDEF